MWFYIITANLSIIFWTYCRLTWAKPSARMSRLSLMTLGRLDSIGLFSTSDDPRWHLHIVPLSWYQQCISDPAPPPASCQPPHPSLLVRQVDQSDQVSRYGDVIVCHLLYPPVPHWTIAVALHEVFFCVFHSHSFSLSSAYSELVFSLSSPAELSVCLKSSSKALEYLGSSLLYRHMVLKSIAVVENCPSQIWRHKFVNASILFHLYQCEIWGRKLEQLVQATSLKSFSKSLWCFVLNSQLELWNYASYIPKGWLN